jgi:hypothetical protein
MNCLQIYLHNDRVRTLLQVLWALCGIYPGSGRFLSGPAPAVKDFSGADSFNASKAF